MCYLLSSLSPGSWFGCHIIAKLIFVECLSRHCLNWSKCSLFPIEEDKINEWFDYEVPSEGNEGNKVIKIMNVERPERRNKIYMNDQPENFPMSLSNDNFEFFVHGTDHDRAKTIIEEGILLSKGAERQDFSDGTGFYLGNDKPFQRSRHLS